MQYFQSLSSLGGGTLSLGVDRCLNPNVRRITIPWNRQLPTKHLVFSVGIPSLPCRVKAAYLSPRIRIFMPNLCVVLVLDTWLYKKLLSWCHHMRPLCWYKSW